MRNVVRVYCGTVLLCACGARSEIAGSGDFFDASLEATTLDVGTHADGSPSGGPDAGTDACTAVAVQLACGGPPACISCKFGIDWSCGDLKYQINAGCGPSDAGGTQAGTYMGTCWENGQNTSTFAVPTTTCDCTDASALVAIVQDQCAHQ